MSLYDHHIQKMVEMMTKDEKKNYNEDAKR
jgi:hypothetical protein